MNRIAVYACFRCGGKQVIPAYMYKREMVTCPSCKGLETRTKVLVTRDKGTGVLISRTLTTVAPAETKGVVPVNEDATLDEL